MKNKILLGVVIFILIIGGMTLAATRKGKSQENVLVVGLDDSFPPMGFRDENNEIVGFDIDLAKAVAAELGMEVEFQPISWAAKEQELDSGAIGCIWNGLAYTKERAETMTLTEPYIQGELYFIVPEDSEFQTQAELAGKKIGVQTGSVQQSDLEQSAFGETVQIVPFSDYLTAFMDLEAGGIDAVCCSSIIGNYLITSKEKNYQTIPSENISTSEGSVVAFKQGNTALRDRVQVALNKLQKDGTLAEISEKWFGEDMLILGEEQ